MPRLKDFKFWRLVPLAAFFLAVPALAQFEVAPDHFDSSAKNAKNEGARKSAPNNKAALARPAASPAVGQATAGAVAKSHQKSTPGGDARSAVNPLTGKTHAMHSSRVDRSRTVGTKHEKESNIAKATPTMRQRE
jgi:hypothetical protein